MMINEIIVFFFFREERRFSIKKRILIWLKIKYWKIIEWEV